MVTKLQFAINPFSTTSKNSFAANQIADWGCFPELGQSGRSAMHHSMEEMPDLQSQKIENIKTTILMHEDIFQRQVRELHRLYDRQTKLTCELKKQMTHSCGSLVKKDANISQFSIWQKQEQDIRSNLPVFGLPYDSGERSASCSEENQRMPKGCYLERVAEERPTTSVDPRGQDQGGPNSSFRPAKSIQTNADEDIDVELTLSIGCRDSRKRSTNQRKPCSLELEGLDSTYIGRQLSSSSAPTKREKREDYGAPSPAMSSSSATKKQENARSKWPFLDLSLNRTGHFTEWSATYSSNNS